jgi:hypothetical protein
MTGKIDFEKKIAEKLDRFYDTVLTANAAKAEQIAKANCSGPKGDTGSARRNMERPVVITARMQAEAEREKTMSDRQPWKDYTKQARDGIVGQAYKDDNAMGIRLMHTTNYGVYLELANDGKYAILRPTLHQIAPAIMETARKFFGGNG